MDCSLLGSSIHGVFQARVLEWGAVAFSKKNSTELQKPNAEAYNNNKKCDWWKKKFKSLIRFHSANKIDNYYGVGGGE